MKQNIYDDPDFFLKYGELARSQEGLSAAGEWRSLRALLPALEGLNVLDLGCGYGWHCKFMVEHGAASVLGIDISQRMIEKAESLHAHPKIRYLCSSIEDLSLENETLDLAISSLALHYVQDLDSTFRKVWQCLRPNGHFVFSIEHPIFTSLEMQDWITDSNGEKLHWPVDRYQDEGVRRTSWLKEGVIKYHRTVASLVNGLIEAGFSIRQLIEPTVPSEILEKNPSWIDENRRPMFMLIAAQKI